MNDGMRLGEFKLRQRELSQCELTTSQKRDAKRLLSQGFSKKAIKMVFGCSYESLKASVEKHGRLGAFSQVKRKLLAVYADNLELLSYMNRNLGTMLK